jgi:hypothetical protein
MLIDAQAARESAKVQREGRAAFVGVQGQVKEVYRAEKVALAFAGFRQQNDVIFGIDLRRLNDEVGTEISGLLGIPALEQLKIVIDYRNGAVAMTHQRH